jgi:hypothetical protein
MDILHTMQWLASWLSPHCLVYLQAKIFCAPSNIVQLGFPCKIVQLDLSHPNVQKISPCTNVPYTCSSLSSLAPLYSLVTVPDCNAPVSPLLYSTAWLPSPTALLMLAPFCTVQLGFPLPPLLVQPSPQHPLYCWTYIVYSPFFTFWISLCMSCTVYTGGSYFNTPLERANAIRREHVSPLLT